MTKICKICGVVKPLDLFHANKFSKDKRRTECKDCIKIKTAEYCARNRDKMRARLLERKLLNPQAFTDYNREYYRKNQTYFKNYNDNTKDKRKRWQQLNAEKINARNRERRQQDICFAFRTNMRSRVSTLLRRSKAKKSSKTLDLLGCSMEFFKLHLQKQFTSGMSWANYGKNGWEIDHIIPCASFDLTDFAQQRKCFHYTNLQPLWRVDNRAKSDKILF